MELTEIVLAGVIFCALPLVTYRGEHVVVDLISLPGRWVRLVQHVITNLIGVVGLVVLCQQMWLRGDRLTRTGETTIQIEIPMNLVAYGISCLFAVTAVAFLVRALIPDEYVRHGASGTGASSLETHID